MFAIYGQQQSHSTQIINGRRSSQIIWQYTLEPQKTGVLTIPALTLKTAAGDLQSQPINIVVSKTPVRRNDNIRLEAIVSNPSPYLHQPILYTLRLYHRGELRDLEPIPPADDVIMEQLSKLTQRRTVVNGRQMIIAQVTYILTPLRSGTLELGSGKMKGLIPDNRSLGNNFFSFNMNYRPTTISSSPITLDVQPPSTSQPWLPLLNLELQQKWESDLSKPVTAGTPLIRTFTLVAKGMGGQSPPKLESFVPASADFRVRSPKPEIERAVLADHKTPRSTITQSFSLIPLNIGALQLPAVRIPWWDVQHKKLAWAELPAQTLQVIPNQNDLMPGGKETVTAATPETIVTRQSVPQMVSFNQTQYALFTVAVFALLIALWQSWYTRRKQLVPVPASDTKPSRMSDSVFKKRLASSNELAAIKGLIQEYAHLRWQTPINASLQTIAQHLTADDAQRQQLIDLFQELNAALYGGKQTFDLVDWKKRCGALLTHLKGKKISKHGDTPVVFGPLNPA